jgi:phosphohistidine phosphatase
VKTLTIVRHAKSDWSQVGQTDFERGLNERGIRNGVEMASRQPDLLGGKRILCSPSVRTLQTLQFWKGQFDETSVDFPPKLYHATWEDLNCLLSQQPETESHVAVIGHHPGLTDWVNYLQNDITISKLPTLGLVQIGWPETIGWSEIKSGSGKLLYWDSPKRKIE